MTVPGSLRVRRADGADLASVLRIDDLVRQGNTQRTQYLTDVLRSETCIVADEEPVIGLVVLKNQHFFGRDFVDYLYVGAEHRRTGVGRTLLRAAVSAAMSSRVFTSTNESNQPMRNLLVGAGWQFSGRLEGLDEDDPELIYFLDAATGGAAS